MISNISFKIFLVQYDIDNILKPLLYNCSLEWFEALDDNVISKVEFDLQRVIIGQENRSLYIFLHQVWNRAFVMSHQFQKVAGNQR